MESLQHCKEQATRGISISVNSNEIELMYFKQEGAICTLSVKPLKIVDQFTYQGSNISSTESDINICLMKARNTVDRLVIIWKSDLSDKIKQVFFQACWLEQILENSSCMTSCLPFQKTFN